jgi:hypothetical protein
VGNEPERHSDKDMSCGKRGDEACKKACRQVARLHQFLGIRHKIGVSRLAKLFAPMLFEQIGLNTAWVARPETGDIGGSYLRIGSGGKSR